MLRTLVFLSLITSAFASLDALVNASANFSAAIEQQLETLQRDPSPTDFAEKTIWYARAKTAYCKVRCHCPELPENWLRWQTTSSRLISKTDLVLHHGGISDQ